MLTDRAYAELCQTSYSDVPHYGTSDGARAFRTSIDGLTIFCFPGSRSFQDWAIDLIALPADETESNNTLDLGPVHAGFLERTRRCLNLIEPDLLSSGPHALCGHSLGGAIALLTGALMVARGHTPPAVIVTFGAPRVGCDRYVEVLRSVSIRQYRFGSDPVPLVPTHPFKHAREPLLQVGVPIRSFDLFANHKIKNYVSVL